MCPKKDKVAFGVYGAAMVSTVLRQHRESA
jgi:hypothetical protein